jgi:hypothetical protein
MTHHYAIYSYMGLGYTLDSPCWSAYAFETRGQRDAWVDANEHDGCNYVARSASRREAYKVAGINSVHKRAELTTIGMGGARQLAATWR